MNIIFICMNILRYFKKLTASFQANKSLFTKPHSLYIIKLNFSRKFCISDHRPQMELSLRALCYFMGLFSLWCFISLINL